MPPPSLFLFGGLFSAAPAAPHYPGNRAAQPLQEQPAALRPPAAPHYPGNRAAPPFREQPAPLRPPAAAHYTGNRAASCFYS